MAQVADQIIIIIAEEFANTPGARNIDEGSFSGEEFLQKALLPAFKHALKEGQTILIDLDGAEGYATSFLEEAFGGLARIYEPNKVLEILEFKSFDEPLLEDEIKLYIKEAKGKSKK
jgi:hypothetical protein